VVQLPVLGIALDGGLLDEFDELSLGHVVGRASQVVLGQLGHLLEDVVQRKGNPLVEADVALIDLVDLLELLFATSLWRKRRNNFKLLITVVNLIYVLYAYGNPDLRPILAEYAEKARKKNTIELDAKG
jgi:hypothetical protein